MSRDGAIILADLIGKLDVLYVHCTKCSRAGRYRVQNLIEERGSNTKLIDWLDELTADCPKKVARPLYSITSSARASRLGGAAMPKLRCSAI